MMGLGAAMMDQKYYVVTQASDSTGNPGYNMRNGLAAAGVPTTRPCHCVTMRLTLNANVEIGATTTNQALAVQSGWGAGIRKEIAMASGTGGIHGRGAAGGQGRAFWSPTKVPLDYCGGGGGGAAGRNAGAGGSALGTATYGAAGTLTAGGGGGSGGIGGVTNRSATVGANGGYAINVPSGVTVYLVPPSGTTLRLWAGGGGGGGGGDLGSGGNGGGPGIAGSTGLGFGAAGGGARGTKKQGTGTISTASSGYMWVPAGGTVDQRGA